MPGQEYRVTENGGVEFVITDENNDEFTIGFDPSPNGNGRAEMYVVTPDGTEKRGEIEPGAGSDRGVGQ